MDALLHISNLLQHAAQDADAAGQRGVADYLLAADILVWDALHEWVGAPPVEVPTEGTLEAPARNMLTNDSSALPEALGKTIASATLSDDKLCVRFTDRTGVQFADAGQSCCETRYMTCGDDLTSFAGAMLVSAETREAPDVEDEHGEVHEVQFLVIKTTKGDITCETHNEHNGYYGGFALSVTEWS